MNPQIRSQGTSVLNGSDNTNYLHPNEEQQSNRIEEVESKMAKQAEIKVIDLEDHFSGKSQIFRAYIGIFLSPMLTSADLLSNIYYIITHSFVSYQIRNAFLFFLFFSLILQPLMWTYRHMNILYTMKENKSFKEYFYHKQYQQTKHKGVFYYFFYWPLFVGIPFFLVEFLKFAKQGLWLGILSDLNVLPIHMQKKIGGIVSREQLNKFKENLTKYYSKERVYARLNEGLDPDLDLDLIEKWRRDEIKQLFFLHRSPILRAESYVRYNYRYDHYSRSEIVQKLQVSFDQFYILLKTMPLLILRYSNIVAQNTQHEYYYPISTVISSVFIFYATFCFMDIIIEQELEPIYWMYLLRKIKQRVFKEKITDLLPRKYKKSMQLQLDLSLKHPRIITFGSVQKQFYQTIRKIHLFLDESQKLQDWQRDPTDFFSALSNIIQLSEKDTQFRFDIDFNSLLQDPGEVKVKANQKILRRQKNSDLQPHQQLQIHIPLEQSNDPEYDYSKTLKQTLKDQPIQNLVSKYFLAPKTDVWDFIPKSVQYLSLQIDRQEGEKTYHNDIVLVYNQLIRQKPLLDLSLGPYYGLKVLNIYIDLEKFQLDNSLLKTIPNSCKSFKLSVSSWNIESIEILFNLMKEKNIEKSILELSDEVFNLTLKETADIHKLTVSLANENEKYLALHLKAKKLYPTYTEFFKQKTPSHYLFIIVEFQSVLTALYKDQDDMVKFEGKQKCVVCRLRTDCPTQLKYMSREEQIFYLDLNLLQNSKKNISGQYSVLLMESFEIENLKCLRLSFGNDNQITNLSHLRTHKSFNDLEQIQLHIEENMVSDFSALSGWVTLKMMQALTLNLNTNKITDISPLNYIAQMNALQQLSINLKSNQIADISSLKSFVKLTNLKNLKLNLGGNMIKDIEPVKYFKNIQTLTSINLDLSKNQIRTIKHLSEWGTEDLYNLRVLIIDLSENEINDIMPLKQWKCLKSVKSLQVNLSKNKIINLSALIDWLPHKKANFSLNLTENNLNDGFAVAVNTWKEFETKFKPLRDFYRTL